MGQETGEIVLPGDRIATEEEFAPGMSAYSENGQIYAALAGRVKVDNNHIGVSNPKKEIIKLRRNMLVLGTVTDDLRTVMFLKLDAVSTDGREYVAIKDGKIVAPREHRDHFGGHGRPPMRRGPPQRPSVKLAGIGDIVLARVQAEEADTYELRVDERETGVVYGVCEVCGSQMALGKSPDTLTCTSCKHAEQRKVSALYNHPDKISELLLNQFR